MADHLKDIILPSHPTPCKGGTLYFETNFSSTTICVATIIWAIIISKSPINVTNDIIRSCAHIQIEGKDQLNHKKPNFYYHEYKT